MGKKALRRCVRVAAGAVVAWAAWLAVGCGSHGLRSAAKPDATAPSDLPAGADDAPTSLALDAPEDALARPDDTLGVETIYWGPCGPQLPPRADCCGTPIPLAARSDETPCSLAVPSLSADVQSISLYLDGTFRPQTEPDAGSTVPCWQYDRDSATVQLLGACCDQVVSRGAAASVLMLCGCWAYGAPPPCIP